MNPLTQIKNTQKVTRQAWVHQFWSLKAWVTPESLKAVTARKLRLFAIPEQAGDCSRCERRCVVARQVQALCLRFCWRADVWADRRRPAGRLFAVWRDRGRQSGQVRAQARSAQDLMASSAHFVRLKGVSERCMQSQAWSLTASSVSFGFAGDLYVWPTFSFIRMHACISAPPQPVTRGHSCQPFRNAFLDLIPALST